MPLRIAHDQFLTQKWLGQFGDRNLILLTRFSGFGFVQQFRGERFLQNDLGCIVRGEEAPCIPEKASFDRADSGIPDTMVRCGLSW